MRQIVNRSVERWAFLPSTARTNDSLAVFIHGFRGQYLDTWGRLPDQLSAHADETETFKDWDYVFLGYSTWNIETYIDIAALIRTELDAAMAGALRYGRPYKRFALFGHSLGTLAIRQLLCAASIRGPALLQCIHSVTLFGSPTNGSGLASVALGYKVKAALEPNNPQLRMLREWCKSAFAFEQWPKSRLIVGLDDWVAKARDAWFVDWPNDQLPPVTTGFDHRHLTKPEEWPNSHVVDYVLGGLK